MARGGHVCWRNRGYENDAGWNAAQLEVKRRHHRFIAFGGERRARLFLLSLALGLPAMADIMDKTLTRLKRRRY